jgi:ankyrin repeat protein
MDIFDQLTDHIKIGRCDKFIELLDQNPIMDLNIVYSYGNTLLRIAANHNRLDCVQELISRGADVNRQTRWGQTVLLDVVHNYFGESLTEPKSREIVKFLISVGGDCNRHYSNGEDLLRFFCWFHCHGYDLEPVKEIIELLLDYGANREYVYNGDTAESYLRSGNRHAMADFIRDYEVVPGTKGVHIDC